METNEITFSKMEQNEWKKCGNLSARAFQDYVYLTNYFSDETRRRTFLEYATSLEIKLNYDNAGLFTAKSGGNILAMAILYPPKVKRVPVMTYLRAGMLKGIIKSGIKDSVAWIDMDSKASMPCHSREGRSWYLSTLAVEPKVQRQGIGSRFMSECIIPYVSEKNGDEICLVTNSEENTKFYEKLGFELFDYREFKYRGNTTVSWSYRMPLS